MIKSIYSKIPPQRKLYTLLYMAFLLVAIPLQSHALQTKITDPLYITDKGDFRGMHSFTSNYRKFDKLASGDVFRAESQEVGFSINNAFMYGLTDYLSLTLDIDRIVENRVKNKNGTLGKFTVSEVGWENPVLGFRYRFWDDGSGYVIDFGAEYEPDFYYSSRGSARRDGRPGDGYDKFKIFMKDGIILGKSTLAGLMKLGYNLGDETTDYYEKGKLNLGHYWDFQFQFEWQHRFTNHFSLNGDIGYHYFGSRSEKSPVTGTIYRVNEPDEFFIEFAPTYEVLPHNLSAGVFYRYSHFQNKRTTNKFTGVTNKEDNKYTHILGITVCYEFTTPMGDDSIY